MNFQALVPAAATESAVPAMELFDALNFHLPEKGLGAANKMPARAQMRIRAQARFRAVFMGLTLP